MNMADVRKREKIAREVQKTSNSIRKNHRALKTGRIEENCLALDRHFKSIIKRWQIIDSPDVCAMKRQLLFDASHRADNNAHDNEMLSIIEELRKAGLIIN